MKLGNIVLAGVVVVVGASLPVAAQSDSERTSARLHNGVRIVREIPRMKWSDAIARKARRHSVRMAKSGAIFHSRCLECKFRRWRWRTLGENVGVGSGAVSLFDAFMKSPSHRANVLYRKFNRFGVGAVKRNGRLWVTVMFVGT